MDGKSGDSLVECFAELTDTKVDRTKLHKLIDIVVMAICAVVAGCDRFEDIEIFCEAREDWFRKFLTLPNGIPSQDTFERVFARIDPAEFRNSFSRWTREIASAFAGEVIAIDGQT